MTAAGSDSQLWNQQTSYYVRDARSLGIDPAPLRDPDAERRRQMQDLLSNIDAAGADRTPGTSAVASAQAAWDGRWSSYVGWGFGGLCASAGASLLMGIAAMGPDFGEAPLIRNPTLGTAVDIGIIAAAGIGTAVAGILSSRSAKQHALADAIAHEDDQNAAGEQRYQQALQAASDFAGEVRAHPTEPVA